MNRQHTWCLALSLALGLTFLAALLMLPGAQAAGLSHAAEAPGSTARYVALTGSDSGACANPGSPCRTVQYAVDQATGGDEVLVASGVYTGVQARAGITQVVYITKTVAIRGGYQAGFGTWDPTAYTTTLDAKGAGRVIYATGPAITLTLEGLRLSGGDANGLGGEGGPYDVGGGLCVLQATAILSGNVFVNNVAHSSGYPNTGRGGGLYLGQGTAHLRNNTFRDNVASTDSTGDGGGLFLNDCDVQMQDNLCRENTATTSAGSGFGGGLFQLGGQMVLEGNTILSNTAKTSGGGYAVGGGVHLNGVTARLEGNAFVGNAASRAGSSWWNQGGGLSTQNSQVLVIDNRFESNTGGLVAAGSGGGLYLDAGTVTVRDNVVVGNHASRGSTGWGGGAYLNNSYGAMFQGNVFQDNVGGTSTGYGGGLDLSQSHQVRVVGNHFVGNAASSGPDGQGGGLMIDYVDVTLEDNVIRGNRARYGGGAYVTNWATYEPQVTWINTALADNRATANGGGSGLYITTAAGNLHNDLLHTTLARNAGGDGSGLYVDLGSAVLTNTLVYSQVVGVQNAGGTVSMTETVWDSVPTPTLGTVAESGSFSGTVALAADGYHLGKGSQAIGAGVYAGVDHDLDGEPRPMGHLPDLGADEYPLVTLYLPLTWKDLSVP